MKFRFRSQCTAVLLTLTLTAGLLPGLPLQAKTEKKAVRSGMAEIMDQMNDNDDTFAPEEGYTLKNTGKQSFFDLRDVDGRSYVTPVRVQNPYGTCWSFGTISAVESSLLAAGIESDPVSLNLSEKQVAWFSAFPVSDPNNPQKGEGQQFNDQVSDSDRYNAGGATLYATNSYASGIGPVKESEDHYYKYSGKTEEVTYDRVLDPDTGKSALKPISYSENDDWSIPEDFRIRNDYRLKESILLPAPSLCETEEERQAAIKAINDQISVHHRAVAISYCAGIYSPNQEPAEDDTMNPDTWAQYDPTSIGQNHVVSLVGYDDNYPKSNFIVEPPGDGAWLVKNSWGSDLNDFPDNSYRHFGLLEGLDGCPYDKDARPLSQKHTGYFWLSYYDNTVQTPEAYSFEAGNREEIINQHDLMPVGDYKDYQTETENRTANVFTAKSTQKLTGVSAFTAKPGTSVTFKVVVLPDNPDNPEDGACVYTSPTKSYAYGGFHREDLSEADQPVIIKGQSYAVIVEEKAPSGKYSFTLAHNSADGTDTSNRTGRWFKSIVNKGESFLYSDGAWKDLTDPSVAKMFEPDDPYYSQDGVHDNFPIKAFSRPSSEQGIYLDVKTSGGAPVTNLELFRTDRLTLKATFRGGAGADLPDVTPAWTSTDPSIFEVEVDNDGYRGKIIPKSGGTAYLIVDGGAYGRKTIKVISHKLELSGGEISEEAATTVYTGKPYEPKLVVAVGAGDGDDDVPDVDLVEGKDYELRYENNVKCGCGEVVMVGIGAYEGERRNGGMFDKLEFIILPAKAKITSVTPGRNQLTVNFASQKESGISGYILSCRETGSGKLTTMKVGNTASSVVIKGLTAGKTYQVSLKAYVTVKWEDVLNEDTYEYETVIKDFFGQESDKMTSAEVKGTEATISDELNVPLSKAEKSIKALKEPGDLKGSTFRKLTLKADRFKKNSIRLKWKKVKGAKGYIIYGNLTGKKKKMKKLATVPAAKKTWTAKSLKKGKYYKFLVLTYKTSGKKKIVTAASRTVYAATAGGKAGNYKGVKLNKKKIVLKKGKSFRIKAKQIRQTKKLKVKKYRKIACESSKAAVAQVNTAGKITAKKKGSCKIYVYTQSGSYATLTVQVK